MAGSTKLLVLNGVGITNIIESYHVSFLISQTARIKRWEVVLAYYNKEQFLDRSLNPLYRSSEAELLAQRNNAVQ